MSEQVGHTNHQPIRFVMYLMENNVIINDKFEIDFNRH